MNAHLRLHRVWPCAWHVAASLGVALALALSLSLAGCASSNATHTNRSSTGAASSTPVPRAQSTNTAQKSGKPQPRFYEGFGNYARHITTKSPRAQKWFDQGIQLLYGFNHDEAIRSFEQAAALDDTCAMAWWGIAYANGLHINNPVMTQIQSERAFKAAQEALNRIDHASPVEQALIRAVSARYAMPVPEDRKPLDIAYADAMQKVWEQYPSDPDVGALYAESLMNLQPWDLWTRPTPTSGGFEPKGRTTEIVATLERVIELDPDHPGANHFYIHAMEASKEPEKALASADLLTTLIPGSGHLVHMPAHIYARLGRWNDASNSNVDAIKVDRAYFKVAPPPEFYGLYFVHNIHFLSWSACMEGRYETAMNAARDLERDIPKDFLHGFPQFADGFMPTPYHIMIRFGKWNEILAEPQPESFRHVSRTMRHYARGVAYSALGETFKARAELTAFEREAAAIPQDWQVGQNKAHDVVAVARMMLTGELAYREALADESNSAQRDAKLDEAFAALRKGVELEDALKYDEPPGWMQPVRHALGALLMGVGRHAEAEQVYRDDLAIYRNNGWALLGLQQSLEAQGKNDQAERVQNQLAKVWTRADVKPTSSCYCQPATAQR
jgi:tetratricopeptide (TPR) repeat protein